MYCQIIHIPTRCRRYDIQRASDKKICGNKMSIKKIEIVVQHDIHSSNIVLLNANFISSNSILAYICIERRIDFVN